MTPPRTPAACFHELRPGTKVCLHCRRAEREATAARHRAIMVRIGVTGAIVGACAYAGFAGYAAWKDRSTAGIGSLMASPASLEAAPAPATAGSSVPATPAAADTQTVPPAGSPLAMHVEPTPAAPSAVLLVSAEAAAPAPAPAPGAVLQPVIAPGRTELENGMYAVRSGDTVTVHFDTPEARTRRPEKFEHIVRTTLPDVHGAAAESILATIAVGTLLGAAELVAEPGPAISLSVPGGQSLSLRPRTRPGRDGPLVVAYTVTPSH